MKDGMIQLKAAAVIQPRTLFKPGSWLAQIDFINHLILFNNVLITILSEKKGGKTSFGILLQNNLDQQIKSLSMTVESPCTRESIISDIAQQLHLDHDANTDITSIVAQINGRQEHVLVIIDEAQHLPESWIKEATVVIKNQENFGFFHLCLIANYSLMPIINSLTAEFFDNLIHTIEIGSLNESEMRTYVLQRAMAAHLINKPLSDSQFKQFYQITKGNIAKINNNLESFIFNCPRPQTAKPLITVKKVGVTFSAVMSAAVIGGVSYWYFANAYKPFGLITAFMQASKDRTVVKKLEQPVELFESKIASWQDSSTRQLVYAALPTKPMTEDIDEEEPNNAAIVDKVLIIPKVKMQNPLTEAIAFQAAAEPSYESRLVKIPVFSSPHVVKKSIAKARTSLYTIQLAANHNKSDIERFRKSNKLFVNAKLRHFTNAKGHWYILTLGEFGSRNEAQHKIKELPSELAKLKPWVRSIDSCLVV